jgi:hypothetical protein
MPRVITEAHQWVVAADIEISEKQARYAARRTNFYTDRPIRIDPLDTSCAMCRRQYIDVADEPCAAFIDNSHLHGGRPDGSRNRTKATGTDAGTPYQLDDEDEGGAAILV